MGHEASALELVRHILQDTITSSETSITASQNKPDRFFFPMLKMTECSVQLSLLLVLNGWTEDRLEVKTGAGSWGGHQTRKPGSSGVSHLPHRGHFLHTSMVHTWKNRQEGGQRAAAVTVPGQQRLLHACTCRHAQTRPCSFCLSSVVVRTFYPVILPSLV